MTKAEQLKQEIEEKKEEIAAYIASSFYLYCNKSEATLLAEIKEKIKDVRVFIVDDETFMANSASLIMKTPYFNKLLTLIEQVKEMTNLDLSYLVNPSIAKAKTLNIPGVQYPKYIETLYLKYSYHFGVLELNKADVYALYAPLDQNKRDELSKTLISLSKSLHLLDLKNHLSNYSEAINAILAIKEEELLQKKYNFNSLDELMDFHSKLQAFFIDESSLNDKEKEILKENKKEILSLLGENISLKELTKLNHRVEKVLNNYSIEFVIKNPLIKEFLKNNQDLHLTAHQLLNIYDALSSTFMGSDGVCQNEPKIKVVSWHSSKGNIPSIYVHEFIHSLETDFTLNNKYPLINELLTEHLSRVAIYDSNLPLSNYQGYNFFDPILEEVKGTQFFRDLLKARIENNFDEVMRSYKSELKTLNHLLKFASTNKFAIVESKKPNAKIDKLNTQLNKFALSLKSNNR